NIFYEKMMSVDVFGGGDGADLNWCDKYKSDWKVFFRNKDVRRSMINNQRNSIIKADSDTIFFTQDDVFLNKVPKIDTLDKLFNGNIINNKPVGFVCYNNHV